ncbi:MAG: 30S ribosomal protein S16 [Acidobacteriota bacterium]|nr:30S ribosomal protein S16 [Blastocatellia bacterium]MDW8412666.1 30S ribosomal protein S16 [Acidobacteriota bacterium]
MLSIRLTRMGAKKRPFYRIVVAEKRGKRDGRFIEILGYYDPCNSNKLKINQERIEFWKKNGAQPTDIVASLIKQYANQLS